MGPKGPRFVHQEWTASNGLPVNQLTGMAQSREGYLWLSTTDGLVRFDGLRFTVFNRGNTPALPTNRFIALEADGDGHLWIVSEGGHLVEGREGTFVDRTEDVGGGARVLFVGPAAVWVGTADGVYRVSARGAEEVAGGGLEHAVLSLLVDAAGTLWVGTAGGGLYRSVPGGGGPLERVEGLRSGHVHSLAEGENGDIWIGLPGAVSRLRDGTVASLPAFADASAVPTRIHPPTGDRPLWVETWSGPRAWDGTWTSPAAEHGGPDPSVGVEGPDGAVWLLGPNRLLRDGVPVLTSPRRMERLLFDHEGTAWVAGIRLHKLRPAVVEQWGKADGLVDNVEAVHADRRGRIWLGSLGGGLARVDHDGVHRFPSDGSTGLPNIVLAIHEDRAGDIWVAVWPGGVCRLDGDTCHAEGVESVGIRRVRAIEEDAGGTLWFGSEDGVFLRDPAGRWSRLGREDGLPEDDVRTLALDGSGRVWMGTFEGGLAVHDASGIRVLGTEEGLSSPRVRSLHVDRNGTVWAGTEGRGLNRIEPVGPAPGTARGRGGAFPARVTVYRVADGLFDEGIHQILEDDFGRLWMSSNRGIFWVSRSELDDFSEGRAERIHATSYTERDGLLNREMNGGLGSPGARDGKGRLWFGGIAGVARVDPATIRRDEVPPPVVIEGVAAGGKERPVADGAVALGAAERDFEIRYTALSFAAPENVR